MKPKPAIPVYDFQPEDDLGHLPLRYASLDVRNDYDFSEPHRHNYYELFFFTKGGGTHLIDFVQHDIGDNSIHLVSPGQVHLLQRHPESYGAVIHFSRDTAIKLNNAHTVLQQSIMPIFTHEKSTFDTITTLLGLLRSELSGDASQAEVSLGYLSLLLLKSIATVPAAAEVKTQNTFSQFRQMAEQHYRTGHQPEWYADKLHITEKKLNEACKAAIGNTVSNYLKERILLEAKRLLSHSEGSIKEIGYYLGFDDPAYFTRFFRKNAGITAGDFRSQYK